MDWAYAIERNRAALLAVVAAVAAMIGLREGLGREARGPIARSLRNAALQLLRPAEAAARRLIVIAARGLAPPVSVARRPFPADLRQALARRPAPAGGETAAHAQRIPAFPLFDRWKRYRPMVVRVRPSGVPRIRTFWPAPVLRAPVMAGSGVAAVPPPARPRRADPFAPVDVTRLGLRLQSLERALADLPRQARRLVRRRSRTVRPGDPPPRAPLRPGRPPGYRLRASHDVDEVLRDCHALACAAMRADTS